MPLSIHLCINPIAPIANMYLRAKKEKERKGDVFDMVRYRVERVNTYRRFKRRSKNKLAIYQKRKIFYASHWRDESWKSCHFNHIKPEMRSIIAE